MFKTSTNTKKSGVKGIFALFHKRGHVADESEAKNSLEFLRKFSDSDETLNEVPAEESIEQQPVKTDAYSTFIATVEKDLKSMQQQKTIKNMRWKIPAGVDGNKAVRGAKRIAPKAQFIVEKIGVLSYLTVTL